MVRCASYGGSSHYWRRRYYAVEQSLCISMVHPMDNVSAPTRLLCARMALVLIEISGVVMILMDGIESA